MLLPGTIWESSRLWLKKNNNIFIQVSVVTIRKGSKEDLPQVLDLIRELAAYEKALDQVDNTVERMEEDGFGKNPVFQLLIAEENDTILGIAIYYFRYSTWKGKCFYLEDLVVKEAHRNRGIGQQLFDRLIKEAQKEKVRLITWQVLDWNEPAIGFYQKLGAYFDEEWINCKLTYEQIQNYSTD